MNETNDPRVFFAAERTLLAWVRTGLDGDRHRLRGGALRALPPPDGARRRRPGIGARLDCLGVAFVLLGSVGIAMGVVQFVRFARRSGPRTSRSGYRFGSVVGFASLLAVTGLLLAIYLLVRIGG